MIAVSEYNIVDKAVDFAKEYFPDIQESEIRDIIERHLDYGTIDIVTRNNDIIAIVRWNISSDGRVCDVLDLIISPSRYGIRIMRYLIARNWKRFPMVKFIRFSRDRKYSGRKARIYNIKHILNLRRV